MTYKDAADRKIKEPIDYLIEASKRSRKLCIALAMSECKELSIEANKLNENIINALLEKPIEEWETSHNMHYKTKLGESENNLCCPLPTCTNSLSPPYLERMHCGNCGKWCDECEEARK
jgi:hypothetical protein